MFAAIAWRAVCEYWLPIITTVMIGIIAATSFNTGVDYGTRNTEYQYVRQLAERDRIAADELSKALAAAHEQAQAALEAERLNLAVSEHTDQQFKIITNTVTKYVETHPKPSTCDIDVDGLRLWNSANRYSPSTTP
jgi:hypothetical protein